MRRYALPFALLCALAPTTAFADAVTTRIETRPYYGAVVTIEQGVRVWRALPPHDRILIVPENIGKVAVNIDAGRKAAAAPAPIINNVNVNKSAGYSSDGVVGLPYGTGHRVHRPPHGHNGHGYYGSIPARRN